MKSRPSKRAQPRRDGRLSRYLRPLGPGLITGASDDDPARIATYAVAGASLGYSTPFDRCDQFKNRPSATIPGWCRSEPYRRSCISIDVLLDAMTH